MEAVVRDYGGGKHSSAKITVTVTVTVIIVAATVMVIGAVVFAFMTGMIGYGAGSYCSRLYHHHDGLLSV